MEAGARMLSEFLAKTIAGEKFASHDLNTFTSTLRSDNPACSYVATHAV